MRRFLFVPLAILKPDDTILGSVSYAYDVFLEPVTLPDTSTYKVLVDPYGAEAGAVTVALYSVTDVTGTISVGGAAVTVPLPTPGQKGRLTMAGVSGQTITVRLTDNSIGYTTVTVLKPDGTELTSKMEWWPNFNLSTVTLSATGDYTIVLDPYSSSAGTITVTVTNP